MQDARYLDLLGRIHEHLRPRTYVEIGVKRGRSLARALPETEAVGIDPQELSFVEPVRCSVQRFAMTSDDFFERHDLSDVLGPVDLAFIDGMHLFEFALRDFMNLERHAHARTVILVHDCKPLDAVTSARERTTQVWTGDVWKLVLVLREYRPDLKVAVVDVPPTGMALVSGLNARSAALRDSYAAICERFAPLGFEAAEENHLELVEDRWEVVRSLLPPTAG